MSKKYPQNWQNQNYLNDFVRIILGLSPDENAIIDTVRSFQMPKRSKEIALHAKVNRQQTNRILKRFEKRQLVIRYTIPHKRDRWRYNRKVGLL